MLDYVSYAIHINVVLTDARIHFLTQQVRSIHGNKARKDDHFDSGGTPISENDRQIVRLPLRYAV